MFRWVFIRIWRPRLPEDKVVLLTLRACKDLLTEYPPANSVRSWHVLLPDGRGYEIQETLVVKYTKHGVH